MITSLRSKARRLLGLEKPRKVARKGPKPAIGAGVILDDVRMIVQAGFSDDLWVWLQAQGWRESRFRPDRRNYREIPASWVTRLIDATPERRALTLDDAVSHAVQRPSLGRGGPATHTARK